MLFKFSYSETEHEAGFHIETDIAQSSGYGCIISVEDYHHLLQNITHNGYAEFLSDIEKSKLLNPTVLNYNNKVLLDACLCGLVAVDYEWYKQNGHFIPSPEEIQSAAQRVIKSCEQYFFIKNVPRGLYIYDEIINIFESNRRSGLINGTLFNVPLSNEERDFIKIILIDCLNESFHNKYIKFTINK